MKILVIDDAPEQRRLLMAWLAGWGHEVAVAIDGAAGVAAYVAFQPDIVLLDKVMPEMDGLETARRIRALDGPWVPIIFISGNADPEDVSEAIEAGGDDYLTKPVSKIVLAAKILAMQRIVAMKAVMASVLPAYIEQELQRLTELDEMTGLTNRYGFERGLAREYARCARSGQPISAIAARLDCQKAEIDGTWAKKLASAFKSHVGRSPDLLVHTGGGHFRAVLPDTPLTGALFLADQIQRTVADLHGAGGVDEASIRFGVATHMPETGQDFAALLEAAEGALDQARRDRIVCAATERAPFRLTPRELECLQLCALGKSTWDIAQLLGISEAAVNFHMTNIRSKCDVSSRRQAVVKALRAGLIRQG